MSDWTDICSLTDIPQMGGVCALHQGQQVAIFNLSHEGKVKSIGNYDPIAKASVISRGIVGDIKGRQVVASPITKLHFCLDTGECLQRPDTKLTVYPVRIIKDRVQMQICA
ncbi:MAG: nitrite reductase (NADH) small subunit [Alteromonadaceae bacterium]|jgi:nitrite reductase (NADH) small subunit